VHTKAPMVCIKKATPLYFGATVLFNDLMGYIEGEASDSGNSERTRHAC
jgi:hypothetical protein